MTNSPESWRPLYPFASQELTIDGLRYHYLDEGAGPTLLLVHGNPTWSFYWRNIVLALRGKYRLIVPDHIGCGLSDKPAPTAYPYRLARRVEDLCRLIEHLYLEDVTLVAHDWGGAIGMGAAVALPRRFSRFALMNTAAFLGGRCPRRIRLCRVPILGQFAVQGLNLFARLALREAVAKPERMTPAVCAGFLAPYDSWAHRAAIYRFVKDIPLSPQHPTYKTLQNIEAGLSQFRNRPVCLIWGMKDWCFTYRFLNRFLDFFPQAAVHRLPDAGHYLVEDAHEQIVPLLIKFLGRPAAGRAASNMNEGS
jgi:pimeloyl-ACP methyl ester carboxylesterase